MIITPVARSFLEFQVLIWCWWIQNAVWCDPERLDWGTRGPCCFGLGRVLTCAVLRSPPLDANSLEFSREVQMFICSSRWMDTPSISSQCFSNREVCLHSLFQPQVATPIRATSASRWPLDDWWMIALNILQAADRKDMRLRTIPPMLMTRTRITRQLYFITLTMSQRCPAWQQSNIWVLILTTLKVKQ